jgi:hypothetical protein
LRVRSARADAGDSLNYRVCLAPFWAKPCPVCGTEPGRPRPDWTVIPILKIGEGFAARDSEENPADDTQMTPSSFNPGSWNLANSSRADYTGFLSQKKTKKQKTKKKKKAFLFAFPRNDETSFTT